MSELPSPPAGQPNEDAVQPPVGRKGKRKAKRLVMVAVKCEERQWPDYREAVYPLLLKFGYFDRFRPEGAKDGSSSAPSQPHLRGGGNT